MNITEIKDLLNRMSIREDVHRSDESTSWKALRKAEKLTDPNIIDQLIQLNEVEKDKKERDRIYFVIGKIAKNINDSHALEYLISKLKVEQDKYVISNMLDRIRDIPKPKHINMQNIIDLTYHDKWLIRYAAIHALNKPDDESVEKRLIEIISDEFSHPYEITYANSCLNQIGTENALTYLEVLTKSRKKDVKLSAQFAIEEINKRTQG